MSSSEPNHRTANARAGAPGSVRTRQLKTTIPAAINRDHQLRAAVLGPCLGSRSGNAVDPLPDEVGVAVVARVLLDHVQVDPADVPGAPGVVTVAGHDIIEVFPGHGGAGVLYFLFECLEVGGRVRVIKRLEVLAGLVRVVREGHVGIGRVNTEPPALNLGHVPHQAKQGQPRWRNRPLLELAGGQARALAQQGVAMEVQPSLKRLALTQDPSRVGALHLRSGPCFSHARHGSCWPAISIDRITGTAGSVPARHDQRGDTARLDAVMVAIVWRYAR